MATTTERAAFAELTREQDAAVERIAAQHGRVCVQRSGRLGAVRATVPGGLSWHVFEDGRIATGAPNHSIDWSE